MSGDQGRVGSVREFAAARAAAEERHRWSRQMNEVLRIGKLEEAQRQTAELARYAVFLCRDLCMLLLASREPTRGEVRGSSRTSLRREKVRSVMTQAKVRDEVIHDVHAAEAKTDHERQAEVGDLAAEVCFRRSYGPLVPARAPSGRWLSIARIRRRRTRPVPAPRCAR